MRWETFKFLDWCISHQKFDSSSYFVVFGCGLSQAVMLQSELTHWGRDKMAAILQKTFWNAFSWMNMLCPLFQSHQWIQTGVAIRKCLIWVKFGNFLSSVTLKFDGWPWKTIGHLFYATSSFVHQFVAISQFKLELLYGNAHFGSKSAIFEPVWLWNVIDDIEKQ